MKTTEIDWEELRQRSIVNARRRKRAKCVLAIVENLFYIAIIAIWMMIPVSCILKG